MPPLPPSYNHLTLHLSHTHHTYYPFYIHHSLPVKSLPTLTTSSHLRHPPSSYTLFTIPTFTIHHPLPHTHTTPSPPHNPLPHILPTIPLTLTTHPPYTHRIITSIRGASSEYGVDESKLKPFEKLLQTLEGKLMEGQIFKVSAM